MKDEPDTTGGMPSQAEMQTGADVVDAGATAAAAEKDPAKRKGAAARAIKDTAKEKGWELSREQAEMLAGMVAAQVSEQVSDKVVDKISERGGFDKPPEPLTAPSAPTGSGTLPEQPPPAGAAAPAPDERPERTRGAGAFAGWFRGGR